jgi:hygromycin-B 4-O-kinase
VLEIGRALDRYFCVSERADGVHLDSVSAGEMRGLVPAIFRMLGALRDADLSGTTGFGGWNGEGDAPHASWREYLRSVDEETERVDGWHAVLDTFPAERAVFDAGRDYLQRNLEFCPEERHLIHNDLLHFNVLAAPGEIRAVVDWGCGLYGDFLYDLAMFTFYAPWYPAMDGIDWAGEAKKFFAASDVEVPRFDERLRCCEAHLALGNMAYSAFTRRPDGLETNARRLTERLAL